MNVNDLPPARDRENPDPKELNRPIPKVVILLVALLLAWAVGYILWQSPGLGSASARLAVPARQQAG